MISISDEKLKAANATKSSIIGVVGVLQCSLSTDCKKEVNKSC